MATDPASGHVCTEIVGLDTVALTFDGGRTLIRSRTPQPVLSAAVEVVSLGSAYTLAAVSEDGRRSRHLFVSVDGGCHWTDRGPTTVEALSDGHDGEAYGWSSGGDVSLLSINGVRTQRLAPSRGIAHVAADSRDPTHVRVFGWQGIFDSTNRGETWSQLPYVNPLPWLGGQTEVAFSPTNLDHVVVLAAWPGKPAQVTRDGGRTWVASMGSAPAGRLWLGPDDRTAWAFDGTLYRSTDGGASFVPAVTVPAGEAGALVRLHAQSDPSVTLFAGGVDAPFSRFLLRLDLRLLKSTRQPLPLHPGEAIVYGAPGAERVRAGTFVAGEPTALCLGIENDPPTPGLR